MVSDHYSCPGKVSRKSKLNATPQGRMIGNWRSDKIESADMLPVASARWGVVDK